MTSSGAVRDSQRHDRGTHRANPLGALLAVLGVAGFCVSIFLNWTGAGSRTGVVDAGPGEQTLNGYDLTPVLPFVALLGVGLVIAVLYAYGKAAHGQHRGLSLVTMATGLAAVGLAVCYLIDPPGLGGAANNVTTKIGIFVALASAAVWSIGAGLFADQTEGDHHEGYDDTAGAGPVTGYAPTESTRVEPPVVR